MLANYHTHTFRCNHATGTEEEYIINCIKNGIKILGFSDHAPFIFPDGREENYRVPMALGDDYISTISALREKYKGQIEIHIGFEMEYYPLYFLKMLSIAKNFGAEYLILGQHFLCDGIEAERHTMSDNFTEADLKEYVDTIIAAIKTKKFSYIAHPDIFNFNGEKEIYRKHMHRLCTAAKQYSIPLEINFLGIENNRCYPNGLFWEVAGEVGCEAVFGCDAHSVGGTFRPDIEKIAQEIADKYSVEVLKTVELKKI